MEVPLYIRPFFFYIFSDFNHGHLLTSFYFLFLFQKVNRLEYHLAMLASHF